MASPVPQEATRPGTAIASLCSPQASTSQTSCWMLTQFLPFTPQGQFLLPCSSSLVGLIPSLQQPNATLLLTLLHVYTLIASRALLSPPTLEGLTTYFSPPPCVACRWKKIEDKVLYPSAFRSSGTRHSHLVQLRMAIFMGKQELIKMAYSTHRDHL